MSMATRIRPAVQRARPALEWVPKPLARLTVEQYEKMVDSGIFTKRDRVQLVNGILVAKVTRNPPHNLAAKNVRDELQKLFTSNWKIRKEEPVRLPPGSEPEPDISMARGHKSDYATRHPGPANLALVVEVADFSLAEDRKLARVTAPPEFQSTGSSI